MGFEYTLKMKAHSPKRVDALLRGVPCFRSMEPRFGGYTYRSWENMKLDKDDGSVMPDAEARIEEYGVYVCVYGPAGDAVFKDIVGQLVSEYDVVEVAKLDWE